MDKTVRRATTQQGARLMQLIASGKLNHDEAQAIIAKFTPLPVPAEIRQERPEVARVEDIAYWDGCFSGRGVEIVDFLSLFADWKPALKPALQDLEERARVATFFRTEKFPMVRVFHADETRQLLDALDMSLDKVMVQALVRPHCAKSQLNQLQKSFQDAAIRSLIDAFQAPGAPVLIRVVFEGCWDYPLLGGFGTSLFYSMGYLIDRNANGVEHLKPLLDLYLAGQFLVGFDKEKCPLFLIA